MGVVFTSPAVALLSATYLILVVFENGKLDVIFQMILTR